MACQPISMFDRGEDRAPGTVLEIHTCRHDRPLFLAGGSSYMLGLAKSVVKGGDAQSEFGFLSQRATCREECDNESAHGQPHIIALPPLPRKRKRRVVI